MDYVKAFAVGGALCMIAQLLIDYTKLTPAKILVGYVVAGVILGGLGIYQPLVDFAGAVGVENGGMSGAGADGDGGFPSSFFCGNGMGMGAGAAKK